MNINTFACGKILPRRRSSVKGQCGEKIAMMERHSLSGSGDAGRQERSFDNITFSVQYTEASYALSFEYEGSKHTFDAFDTMTLTGFDCVGPIMGVFAKGEGNEVRDVTFWELRVE